MEDPSAAPDLPSFVADKNEPVDNLCRPVGIMHRFFDFWRPYRTNREDVDFAQGQQYCDEAIVYARTVGDRYFLPNVIASVGRMGAVERGFFDRVATRATYGVIPAPLADIELEIATVPGRHKEGDLRRGEAEAADVLKMARLHHCPETIFNYLLEIHSGRLPLGVEAQVYVIAGAAVAGSSN
jgi:hypothetical protein